jgi:hypothetical protein
MIEVLGIGRISFFDEMMPKEEVQQLAERMKENEQFYRVEYLDEGNEIEFEMSGNKRIDYTELDKIKKELVGKKARIQITVTEYVEGETGYYFSNEADDP